MVSHYYKTVNNGYIEGIGVGYGEPEITEDEYYQLTALVQNMPTAPEGYKYLITENGEYELHEAELMPEPEPTADELLDIILGGIEI